MKYRVWDVDVTASPNERAHDDVGPCHGSGKHGRRSVLDHRQHSVRRLTTGFYRCDTSAEVCRRATIATNGCKVGSIGSVLRKREWVDGGNLELGSNCLLKHWIDGMGIINMGGIQSSHHRNTNNTSFSTSGFAPASSNSSVTAVNPFAAATNSGDNLLSPCNRHTKDTQDACESVVVVVYAGFSTCAVKQCPLLSPVVPTHHHMS